MHGGECRDGRYTRRRERCGSRAEGACSRSHGFRLCCVAIVAMVMTIGYELIYLDREISRYEDTCTKRRYEGEGQKVGQESRSQKGCHEDESSEEPLAPGAWEV